MVTVKMNSLGELFLFSVLYLIKTISAEIQRVKIMRHVLIKSKENKGISVIIFM